MYMAGNHDLIENAYFVLEAVFFFFLKNVAHGSLQPSPNQTHAIKEFKVYRVKLHRDKSFLSSCIKSIGWNRTRVRGVSKGYPLIHSTKEQAHKGNTPSHGWHSDSFTMEIDPQTS